VKQELKDHRASQELQAHKVSLVKQELKDPRVQQELQH
jgi:hypothetical protein